ncbi:MAG: hypothetical protein ACRD43_11895 [Pyrinomonadaceae bacterium]
MVKIFQIMAVILLGVAAFFLWKQNSDWAFASGVLAACSFFLSLRSQMKAGVIERQAAQAADQHPDDDPAE